MPIVKRVLVRAALRRIVKEGDPKQAALARVALGHRKLLNNLNSRIDSLALGTPSASKIGDGDLLKWLWEKRKEILAFIKELMELFS